MSLWDSGTHVEWPLFSTVCGFSLPRVLLWLICCRTKGPEMCQRINLLTTGTIPGKFSGCGHPKEGAHVETVCNT